MEVMYPRCAGLDVHKETVVACVRLAAGSEASHLVRTFATTTAGLIELGEWLEENGCTHVAMEATGVYWKPVWQVLADSSFELILANAAQVKNVPRNAAQYTAFSAKYATERAIDLTSAKYNRERARWMHVTDHQHCQAFADTARAAQIEIIRYASVRDPGEGMNLALLTCRAFEKREPIARQTWHIQFNAAGAHAVCEAPKSRIAVVSVM